VPGLPFDASFITQLTLPTVTAKLVTEQTGQQRLPTRHYSVTLQVELLGATLENVLASVTLAGCGLRSHEEDHCRQVRPWSLMRPTPTASSRPGRSGAPTWPRKGARR